MGDMNVAGTTSTQNTYTDYQSTAAKVDESSKAEEVKSANDAGVVYEKSEETDNKKAIYSINKMSAEDRAALVKQLKQEEANRRSQLIDLVQRMITGQAGVANLADLFTADNLKNVTAEDIAKAKEDISEDGYWGIKQTSQRLFDFASALAGDDVDKMKEMQSAMEKGFKQAAGAWGKDLPDICSDTLSAANKLFDDYYASKEVTE